MPKNILSDADRKKSKDERNNLANSKLYPYYVGVSEHKTLKNEAYKTTHYVLINVLAAKTMGMKPGGKIKPGSDKNIDGLVFTNRKASVTSKNKAPVSSKRYLTKGGKDVQAYTTARKKLANGVLAPEICTVAFPSNIPIPMIQKFFKDNCPKVDRIHVGKNFYSVR
jgi:hypothetical protein